MSATNHTANYNLPQFIGSDKPAWLTDVNGAMSAIDLGIAAAQAKADGADTKADTVGANLETLSSSVTTLDTAVTTLSGTVTSQGGTINTITSLIGNGEPTTTDKTIIGAINELNGERDAEDIAYDNTTSGLTASNVQAAIDEIAQGGGGSVTAANVTYDNTSSGLIADDVQKAIDEVNAKITGTIYDFDLNNNVSATVTSTYTTGAATSVNVLTNTDKTIGKIYGGVVVSGSIALTANAWTTIATITASNLPTITTAYDINIGFGQTAVTGSTFNAVTPDRLHFNTDGTVEVQAFTDSSVTIAYHAVSLPPCLYFLKDLGD